VSWLCLLSVSQCWCGIVQAVTVSCVSVILVCVSAAVMLSCSGSGGVSCDVSHVSVPKKNHASESEADEES